MTDKSTDSVILQSHTDCHLCQRSWSSGRLGEDLGSGFTESPAHFSCSPPLVWSPYNLALGGPINLTSPRSRFWGNWAACSPYCSHSFYSDCGQYTREHRGCRSGRIWFSSRGASVFGGASATLLSSTVWYITLTLTGTLPQSQFPGLPTGISYDYLKRGNLLKYKYGLWFVCCACQLKDISSSITLKMRTFKVFACLSQRGSNFLTKLLLPLALSY